jgi:5-methylcytosine-specific restriction endonuclease McrA
MKPRDFLGRWKPTTTGERLLHFLVTNVAELRSLGTSSNDWIPEVSRSRSIADFLHGVVVLHVFGRLLQASKAFRKKHLDDEEKCLLQIENFLIEKLSITRATCDRFDEVAPLALDAARASSKNSHTVSHGKRREIQEECRDTFNCYSCGADLDPYEKTKEIPHPEKPWRKIPNLRFMEYEHIWPHSFGGDTIVANLAPVCLPCNDAKKNSISWEWTLVQSLLPTTDLGQQILDPKHTSRSIRVSLHMRAAMLYARTHGTTLKDALRAIGPRESSVLVIDAEDTPDFFNLKVHNSERTGIQWDA